MDRTGAAGMVFLHMTGYTGCCSTPCRNCIIILCLRWRTVTAVGVAVTSRTTGFMLADNIGPAAKRCTCCIIIIGMALITGIGSNIVILASINR